MANERTSAEAPPRSPEVDAFLAAVPEETRTALEVLRQTIAAAAPEAVEAIGYGVPAFKYRGRPLVSLGAGKSHCAFYVQSPAVGTIRFAPEAPLPDALVTKLVRARIAETDAAKRS